MKKLLLALSLFFGAATVSQAQCSYTLTLEDSWGDGWNGNTMDVWVAGTTTNYTLATGSSTSYTINVPNYGDSVAFIFQGGGAFISECSYKVEDASGNLMYQSPNGSLMTVGAAQYGTSCVAPTCTWQVTLLDSWGDGWNGNTIDIYVNGTTTNHTLASGSAGVVPVNITDGDSVAIIWQGGGSFASECTYEVLDNTGSLVYSSGTGATMTVGVVDFGTSAACLTGPNPCLVSTFPFTEDFETWSGTIPSCWAGIKTSTSGFGWTWDGFGTGSSGTGPLGGNSGDYYLYLETSGGSTGNESFAELPPFDLSSVFNPQLKFNYHMAGVSMGSLRVEVSTDNKATWTSLWSISGPQHAQADAYTLDSVNLVGFGTTETWIRFVGVRGTSFTGDMAIDDIYVGDGPLCPGAGGITFNNITGNSVEVSWSSTADNKIEYGLAGFAQGTGMVVSPATSPVTLTGLQGSSTYDVYVQDSCSATSVVWVGPYSFTTLQSIEALPYYESFENDNGDYLTSGTNNSWEHGAPAGSVITTASQGTAAWVTNLDGTYNSSEESELLTPYFDNTAGTWDMVYEFQMALATENNWDETWVEYSFDDVTWTKLTAGNISENWYNDLGNQWWEGNADPSWTKRLAVIPNSAGEMVHIRHRFSSDSFLNLEGVGIDEVQAYEIPCDFPVQNFAASNFTSSSVDIHWLSNSTTWEIEVGPVGFGQATGVGTITPVTNDTTTISLNPCDSVDVFVRATCGGTNGPWVGPLTIGALCEYDVKLVDFFVDVNTCGDSATEVHAVIESKGLFDLINIPVHADVTGGITAALSATYSDTLSVGEVDTILVGTFNSYNGAVGVDIDVYTALSSDQNSVNDSDGVYGVGYIGPTPLVADIDTVCKTDPFGTFFAEPITGLRYGWYASPTDTVATAVGDSFQIPMSGQLTWYLGYEKPLAFLEAPMPPNNGLSGNGSGVAFSVMPANNMTVTGLDLSTWAAAGASVDVTIAYRLSDVTTANYSDTAWIYTDTITAVSPGGTAMMNVAFNTPINLPGGQMSAIKVSTTSGIRYITGNSFGATWASNASLTIYQGLSFSSPTSFIQPRNFSGRVYYDVGDACSQTKVPVTMGIYADTAQADFTFNILADGYTVFFDASNSVGDEFMWDFNDGTVGYGDTITHTFADSVDAYAVCLFVDDTVCMTSDMMCDAIVTTVGLDETEISSLKIYPNPTANQFNVEFTALTANDYNIEVVDASGRVVANVEGQANVGQNVVRMNKDLADGVYMVRTVLGDRVNVSRLVVRH